MSTMTMARSTTTRLRDARRLLVEQGELAATGLAPQLARSWGRSLAAGLHPSLRSASAPHASTARLARALDRQHELVAHARPVMEFVARQTMGSNSLVLLADAQGLLLQALGDADFVGRAERVALRPGANWHEQFRGTNAIGTTLADVAPVVVHGAEHFLDRNGFLTCAAAPIVAPSGRLLGAIDISGDHRGHHPHTFGLVRTAAGMIEHRLFDTWHAGALRLRFHAQVEGIGTLAEGLIAVSDDGVVIGANGAALEALGLDRGTIGTLRLAQAFELELEALHDWSHRVTSAPRVLASAQGPRLWVRLDAPRRAGGRGVTTAQRVIPAAASNDALAALDTGDAAMHAAILRARRVLDKPIALLLQGESGVGKEVFARALHASGPRRDKPFVAVNCAALPETLIEAELFGYSPGAYTGARREGAPGRIREAHGGTLFLDEIGDMPLAMQGRLLRVLQERQVVPLGGGRAVTVDFALVCATHRRLRDEMDAGRFREDLYYRLNGLTLQLPALRERDDLDALVERLLREIEPARALQLAPALAQAFRTHHWRGNLRELANALRTACALVGECDEIIDASHLPDDLAADLRAAGGGVIPPSHPAAGTDDDAEHTLRDQSARAIERAMAASRGKVSEASRRLGISRNTLYRKLRALGLQPPA